MVTASQLEKVKASIIANPYLIPDLNLNVVQEKKFSANYQKYFLSRKIELSFSGSLVPCSPRYIDIGMITPNPDYRGQYVITEFEECLYSVLRTLYRAEEKSCPTADLYFITSGHDGHDREWLIELYIATSLYPEEKHSIVGWSSWCDIETLWHMSVIWVHPFLRHGFIKQNWRRWQTMYGGFKIQGPFSAPMKKALKKVDYQ